MRLRECMRHGTAGFTLLELSIVLIIIALVTGMAVTSGLSTVESARQAATLQKMKAIDQALMAYRVANNRLPCPGDLTIAPGGTNFGIEAGGSSVCTTATGVCTGTTLAGACIGTAVTPAANASAAGATYTLRTAAEGALPVVTLGLPQDAMYDGWGNKFRYAVDSQMTLFGAFHDSPVNNTCGPITINDVNGNARENDAIYALISHGANGHGAYTPSGAVVNASSVNAAELANCHCTSSAGAGTYTATYVQEQSPTLDPSNYLDNYDDLITYKERWQMQTSWDPVATIYIADGFNFRVRKVTGCIITTVAGNGTFGHTGDGGAATSAALALPGFVTADSSGNLYISDTGNNCIRKVTVSTGIITTVAGHTTAGACDASAGAYSGDGAAATSAKLYSPKGTAVDSSGNLYIADAANYRVREVTASTGIITTVAGTGTAGYSGDGGQATSAMLNAPANITLDSSGNLYIADTSNNRIRKVTVSTGIIFTVAGNGTAGYSGDGGAATSAELSGPYGMAVDSFGNLYIADTSNNRIRKVTVSTGIISTVAGNGTTGFSGDGGPATSAELESPFDVEEDSSGNLYIADTSNNRIRKVSASTGIISTIAGNGGAGYGGDGGPATSAHVHIPYGVPVIPGPAISNR